MFSRSCYAACGWMSLVLAAWSAPVVIEDFEARTLPAGWQAEGAAFAKPPFQVPPGGTPRFAQVQGTGALWSGRDEETGTLTSPEFTLAQPYLNFRIFGERNLPAQVGVELLVGGKVVRACAGTESFDPTRALLPRCFAVEDLRGQQARLRVNDHSSTGSICVDAITLSDTPEGTVTDAATPLHEHWRPRFHFTAQSGWLNDANGTIFVDGQWHLFHQHRPPSSVATVWGHATSRDLVHWQHQPTALPAEERDAIFSGTAYVDAQNTLGLAPGQQPTVVLAYTQHPPGNSGRKAVQALAYSTDGARTFQKYAGNPVLQTPDNNDRDPKLFFHAPSQAWWMVLSLSRNNTQREKATYGLFQSRDLRAWTLRQEVGPGSWYWECPDMFPLPVEGDPAQTKWLLLKGSGDYLVGSFDGEKFTPETEPLRTSWGASYYGAQSFENGPQGRRVQIGWMNTPKEQAPNAWPGMPFNQQMSFPRELTLRRTPEGPRLFREPVREVAQLWGRAWPGFRGPLPPEMNALAGVTGETLDLDLALELGQAKEVRLTLRGQEVVYTTATQTLQAFGRKLAWPAEGGVLRLRALLDTTSLELFGNAGALTHSGVFFAELPAAGHQLTVVGGVAAVLSLTLHELRSIW